VTGFQTTGLLAVLSATAATQASAYEVSDIVGRWDCSISNRASKMNARTYFTVEETGAASSIGTVQFDGDEGILKFQFKDKMTIRVEGNSLFETPVSATVLSASLAGQDLNDAAKRQTEAALMTPYDGPAQILSVSSNNLVYEQDGTIYDCGPRE